MHESLSAGDILQGVQSHYSVSSTSTPPQRLSSPLFVGGDARQMREIDLATRGATVVAVTSKSGNLVDSLTLHLSDGSSHRFGGDGGDTEDRIEIPPGWMLLGFFGGQ